MTRRRSFVPECPVVSGSLEGRVSLSIFGSIGNWFSSQYSHVKQDLGISHKPNTNAAAGIEQLWKQSAHLGKPQAASSFIHVAVSSKSK
jgi:hypothetical protein